MKRTILVIIACMVISTIHAQDSLCPSQRPKVGVVLAGGGARGASFIGALKYLEELDIPVDYIIGTSMGSIIGGVYALGYSPDEISQVISSIKWSKYIGNNIDRSLLSEHLRERHSTQIASFPINVRGILKEGLIRSFLSELPSAYVNNNEVDNLLNELCHGYQDSVDFNSLPIPFACIATDIVAGEEVIIHSGSLPKAIRASMAFPVIFSPVVIDGRLLYDGGLTNIFPSDVLREMGADIIIGIEFSNEKYFIGESIPSVSKLFDYMYNFFIHAKREDNRQLCDLLIKPNTADFGPLSFRSSAIDTLIQLGYEEARNNEDALLKIKHQIDSAAGYPVANTLHYAHCGNPFKDKAVRVNSIVMNGPDAKQTRWLKRKGNLHEGGMISTDDIRRTIELYQGTGVYDRISYDLKEMEGEEDAYCLSLRFQQPCPDVFGFGMHYDTEEGAALLFTLGLNEKRLSGSKLKLRGRLSFNPQVTATFTRPVSTMASLNVSYDIRWPFAKTTFQDNSTFSFRDLRQEIKVYASTYQTRDFQADAGFTLSYDRFNHVSDNNYDSSPTLPPEDFFTNNYLYGAYININYDNLDRFNFARRGINTILQTRGLFELNRQLNNFQDLCFSFQGYVTPFNGRVTIIPQLYGRMTWGNISYVNLCNIIGGEIAGRYTYSQLPFVGINNMTAFDENTAILRCDIRYNFLGKHYLSAIGNMAFGTDRSYQNLRYYTGIGLKYSYDSLLGPISLTAQWSDLNQAVSAYFSFGYYF